uniref:Uncharacterized protein n=1 Tax=Romanomermis culicivorax TaxID=13658 RepID=A0A915K4Q4_ROMCU
MINMFLNGKVEPYVYLERTGPRDMGATATCEIETEHDKDAQAQFERTQAIAK